MKTFSRCEGGKRMPNSFFSETHRFEIFLGMSLHKEQPSVVCGGILERKEVPHT